MYTPSGIIASIVTPFKRNCKLDVDGLNKLIRYQLDNGVDGILVGGFNGEFTSLSIEELKKLYLVTVEEVNGQTKVVTQTGLPSTRETIDLTSYSEKIGADAVMIMPPYYILPTKEGIYKHYKTIAKKTNIPIVIFDFPRSGHPNLSLEFVKRLTSITNMVGIKEAITDVTHMQNLIRLLENEISVLNGLGSNTLPALAAGAKGVMAGYIAVAPKLAKELFDAFKGGNFMRAMEINVRLYPLMRLAANASGIKAALGLMGLSAGPVRLPLVPFGPREKEKMRNILTKLDLCT